MTLKVLNADLPNAVTVTTKYGINLGCGTTILPCERPDEHMLIPLELYTDPAIVWHNVDRNPGDGVNRVLDLFDYPWRTETPQDYQVTPLASATTFVIPDNMYDVAIAAHIVEHIPHYIVENGQFVPRHPDYQDGWFRWFAELNRILKPGGKAYFLCPYGWSNSGLADPTHTRYLLPATFNYFNNAHEENAKFRYKMGTAWAPLDVTTISYRPHILGVAKIKHNLRLLNQMAQTMVLGEFSLFNEDYLDPENHLPNTEQVTKLYTSQMFEFAQVYLNMIPEFLVEMRKADT